MCSSCGNEGFAVSCVVNLDDVSIIAEEVNMKLSLKNIGKMGRASVDIDGITVIAKGNVCRSTGRIIMGKRRLYLLSLKMDI